LLAIGVVVMLFLAACGGNDAATSSTNTISVTTTTAVNVPATQTRAVELTQVAAALAPTATSAAPAATATSTAPPATATATRPASTNTPIRPTATATPGRAVVEVQNVSNSRDSIGSLYFIGEVVNKGDAEVTNIQIAVSLMNDTGQVAASGTATTIGVNILAAGQKTVWSALVQNAPATWKEERVQVQAGPVTAAFRNLYAAGLSVEGVTVNPPANTFSSPTVAGQVKNGGDAPAKFVLVTVGGYDEAGKLVVVEIGSIQLSEIAPGSTAPFSVNLSGTKVAPPKVDVYAKGLR
jgi:hypothetical protein